MRRNIYLLVVLVTQFLAAHNYLYAETPADTVKFRLKANGRIIVPVRINDGEVLEFLVDTGATTTTLTSETARRLKLEPTSRTEVDTPTGTITIPQGSISRITMGKRSATDVKVYWTELPVLRGVDSNLSGILGLNFLKQFNFAIDFESKSIRLMDGSATPANGDRIPMRIKGGRMLLSLTIGGTRVDLALDSGASHVFLYSSGCRKLGTHMQPSEQVMQAASNAGSISIESAFLDNLWVGGVKLDRLAVGLLRDVERPADGLLPLHLFRSVYVNNLDGYVIVNPRSAN